MKSFTATLKLSLALSLAVSASLFASHASAQEAPDALVMRVSQEVLTSSKTDKQLQSGNTQRAQELVETKILPSMNFQHMTALATGRHWRDASAAQQQQLTDEFRLLLVRTYSGALAKVKDQKFEIKPLRMDPADTDVEVKSLVLQPRGEPLQLTYRLEKTAGGWKIYDVNIMGAWLVETYKGNFSAEINKAGIDGLIKTLAEKNRRMAAPANT